MSPAHKILRLDSVGGASGDMLVGVMLGLGLSSDALAEAVRKAVPDEFAIRRVAALSKGIAGFRTHVDIPHQHGHDHDHDHEHHSHGRSYADIRKLLTASALSEKVRAAALRTFQLLAEAEAAIHGVPVDAVHFHEVGAVDSLVDIVGACWGFVELGFDAVSLSPLPTGSGVFECAHGIYPLPAPATLALLERGKLRHYPGGESLEMVTPTAAALLAAWEHAEISPDYQAADTTYSLGHREFAARPNLLRGTVYDYRPEERGEALWQLECNIDDATPEILADAARQLLAAGALDVWQQPIVMKKDRSAVMLSLIAPDAQKDALAERIFELTPTFGVRLFPFTREKLAVSFVAVVTAYGEITVKCGARHGRVLSRTPEFESCRAAAEKNGVATRVVYAAAVAATAANWPSQCDNIG